MTPAASSLAPRPLLGGFLLLAALGAATWAAVIAFWYAQRRVVSLQDVLLYLLALPLLLFAGVLVARRALRAAGSAAPAAVPAGSVAGSAAGSGPSGAGWPVLGAWVGCAGGSDLDLLVSTLAHELPHPAPDPRLRDADGLPVPSARIATLEPAAVEAALPEGVNLSPAALRALAALSPLLDQVGETLAPGDGEAAAEAAGPARSTSTPVPALHVLAHWPSGWSASETAAAQAWLAQRLRALAPGIQPAWPAAQAVAPATGAEFLSQAQRQLDALRTQARAGRVLLLACHSDLDDDGVQRLEREGRLYAMPRRPEGVMPGEAAAALLLRAPARPGNPAAPAGEGAGARLSWQVAQQARGAAPSRRPDAAGLQALLGAALDAAGLNAAAVAALSADAAQHAGAALEVHALAQAALPQLDAVQDIRLLGSACGHTGAVAPLLALASAWALCRRDGQATLAVSVTEGEWRVVGVVKAEDRPA